MPDNANNLFTTGVTLLPDIGEMSYNGVDFSPLFVSEVSGTCVKDEAQTTVKYMEYTLSVDGYVTATRGVNDIVEQMDDLRTALSQQGGHLIYKGRGCDLIINPPGVGGNDVIFGAATHDVVWGPVPELLEFQPLGGGLSAKIKWQCKIRIPEITKGKGFVTRGGLANINMLQFNYETNVSYGEDRFSNLSVRGVLEIPLTRPDKDTRTLQQTADDLRNQIDAKIMTGIDLTRFRVVNSTFNLSRDKRTMDWDVRIEEKPYMDLPPQCNIARGTYSVRPAKSGMGLCLWLCTLRSTYTLRNDASRRVAWLNFLALMRIRMAQSELGFIPKFKKPDQGDKASTAKKIFRKFAFGIIDSAKDILPALKLEQDQIDKEIADMTKRIVWLIDFSYDEGLYLDSKSITFSATWRLTTTFSHILIASGLWKKVPENAGEIWVSTMKDVSGSTSWLDNRVKANLDVIVDFGS